MWSLDEGENPLNLKMTHFYPETSLHILMMKLCRYQNQKHEFHFFWASA